MTLIELINKLKTFWSQYNCIELMCHDIPIGAATYHPTCFFQAISCDEHNYMYVNPCRRLADGREGQSDQRLLKHHQFQVTLKLPADKVRKLYMESLDFLGINGHVKFIENNWASQSIGAYGKGWEVLFNMVEITQFTFFQKIGDTTVDKVTTELAYGLERLLTSINNKPINQCLWHDTLSYQHIRYSEELYMSQVYRNIDLFSVKDFLHKIHICQSLLEKNNYYGAYEILLIALYIFNCLEARKLIGPLEHKEYMYQTKEVAKKIVELYKRI